MTQKAGNTLSEKPVIPTSIETSQKETRRRPAQERSRKRYDAILNAAKSLIAKKGSAQLKIHEIAELAQVTPASIYQYFPSKNAITLALAQHTFDHAFASLTDNLPKAESLEHACLMLQNLIEEHYQIYLNDPALLDIWVSISADKTLQDLDLEDSRRQATLIYNSIKSFFPENQWEKLHQISFLLSHMVGSAIRMALQVSQEEGRGLMDSFKCLLNPSSLNSMLAQKSTQT